MGTGRRDLTGRFEFSPGALDRLKGEEWRREAKALSRETSKRVIDLNDGLGREWRVRAFKSLHQGRVALLERMDGVALLRVSRDQSLKLGKTYSISMSHGKAKATPSLGLER